MISSPSTGITLNGTIQSSNDLFVLINVTLASDTIIDTNATNSTGGILINTVTGNNNNLTLSTGDNVNANINMSMFSQASSGIATLTLRDICLLYTSDAADEG